MHPLALPPRLAPPLDAAQVPAKRCCACAAATGAATEAPAEDDADDLDDDTESRGGAAVGRASKA